MAFFVLSDPFDKFAMRLTIEGYDYDKWRAAVRGAPVETLRARHYMGGRKCKDLLWTSMGSVAVVSSRVCELFRLHGITGWGTYPVVVEDAGGNELPGYYGLAITGRCRGRIGFDRRESQLVVKTSAVGRPILRFHGLEFDELRWDGSDLFRDEWGSGWTIVTDRVARLIKKAKIRNCEVRETDSIEITASEHEIIRGA